MSLRNIRSLLRPYGIALLLCLIFIIIGLCQTGHDPKKDAFDIQLPDAYIVISYRHWYFFLAFIFFWFSLAYLILDSWLAKGKGRIFQYVHLTSFLACGILIWQIAVAIQHHPYKESWSFGDDSGSRAGCAFLYQAEAYLGLFFALINAAFLIYYLYCILRKYIGLMKSK